MSDQRVQEPTPARRLCDCWGGSTHGTDDPRWRRCDLCGGDVLTDPAAGNYLDGMVRQTTVQQEEVDSFYWSYGKPCCAGCDWWHHINSVVGECRSGAPVAEAARWAMLGITGSSLATGAGHVITARDHHCGYFNDTFDWSSLPPAYQRRVGVPGHAR